MVTNGDKMAASDNHSDTISMTPQDVPQSDTAAVRRAHNEQYGIREGACTAIMQGAGENFFTAFALTFNATTSQIGLLNALPAFVGTFAQLGSVLWLRWFDHRHTIVIAGAAAQAVLWLPLLLLPFLFPEYGATLVIACAVPLVVVGHFSIPAWSSLITDLLNPDTRGTYFAKRARIMSAITFTALIGGGLLLSWTEHLQATWVGFTVLFLLAAVARGVAARYLQRLDESDAPVTEHLNLRLKDFVVAGRHEAFLRFLLFSGFMHISALLAGPFFALYLLRDLHLSYMEYSLWAAASVIGGFLAINGWGRIGDLYGNRKLLMTTGFGLPVLPLLYLTTEDVWWLIMINGLAGMLWSGFNLGLQNIVYDLVKSEERAGAVAMSNGVIATSAFMGTMLGGWLSTVLAPQIVVGAFEVHFVSNLLMIFLVSALLRLAVAIMFIKPLKEVRDVEPISHHELFQELPLIKPMMDVIGRRVGHQP
jgi:MFS family permease